MVPIDNGRAISNCCISKVVGWYNIIIWLFYLQWRLSTFVFRFAFGFAVETTPTKMSYRYKRPPAARACACTRVFSATKRKTSRLLPLSQYICHALQCNLQLVTSKPSSQHTYKASLGEMLRMDTQAIHTERKKRESLSCSLSDLYSTGSLLDRHCQSVEVPAAVFD
jgi:hypothetical protein